MKRTTLPIKENDLQSAIVFALQSYATAKQITVQSSWKYSNQQGANLRKICADFATTLNHSAIFLAEVKVQHSGALIKFEKYQYDENLFFELAGYPIYYVYNATSHHPYWDHPQQLDWYELTLETTNYSPPSELPGKYPHISSHPNLLDWLKRASAISDNTDTLAEIFARIRANELNNGILMLIYGTKQLNVLKDLSPEALTELIDTLKAGSGAKLLNAKEQKLLKRFLDREEEFFRVWAKPTSNQVPTSDSEPDPDDHGSPGNTSRKSSGPHFGM